MLAETWLVSVWLTVITSSVEREIIKIRLFKKVFQSPKFFPWDTGNVKRLLWSRQVFRVAFFLSSSKNLWLFMSGGLVVYCSMVPTLRHVEETGQGGWLTLIPWRIASSLQFLPRYPVLIILTYKSMILMMIF